ncbi:MAG: hypothetical protein WBG08_13465 [Litorimonas sp.]
MTLSPDQQLEYTVQVARQLANAANKTGNPVAAALLSLAASQLDTKAG